ncbi:50S ribosomal protein L22 [Candidatus Beckwithbacteria bacterium RBG_13_42_9]|uniref:Large ribosomal subunit protein uL22 n=1 Tax=Candidatus Beckwithbacteria bacterium RBG_13_42_9 TaxID=1797457 RepID=A0A1F5E8T3_9BACT|nr:MAG: 50S ribosomal protein L22 [Candidatus Beckwithbacteria bacterium RBG_13_42_9]
MEIRAYQKSLRISPRKMQLVADSVRRLPPQQALTQLRFMGKRGARLLAKVFKQAISNATNNLGLSPATLTIKHIHVEEGPTMKRWQPVSRGRGHEILKRSTHIKLILESKEPRGNKLNRKVEKANIKENKEPAEKKK